MSGQIAYAAMTTPACDGYPASDRELPLWASIAAEREGRRVAEDMERQLGKPTVLIIRTHWHEDGSFCAHIADRAYRITRRQITERGARKARG